MKKYLTIIALLLLYTQGYANTLTRFINKYKDKEEVVYLVFNKDSHFNDATDGIAISQAVQQIVSGTMRLMGIEEIVYLKLDSCEQSTHERFVERLYDAIPNDFALLTNKEKRSIYMSNSDEEYAYILIANEEAPSMTLMYVTNSFIRAIMDDEGNGIDMDKFEKYIEKCIEGLEETIYNSGELFKKGIKHLEKQIEEYTKERESTYKDPATTASNTSTNVKF